MAQFGHVLALVPHVADLRQLKLRAPCATTPRINIFAGPAGATRRLATLHLSGVNLGHPNLLAAISASPAHPLSQVEDLALRGCFLGDTGAASLGALVAHMSRLRSLVLADNGITRSGTGALVHDWSRVGRSPDTLVTLDLSFNPIGIEGARLPHPCPSRLGTTYTCESFLFSQPPSSAALCGCRAGNSGTFRHLVPHSQARGTCCSTCASACVCVGMRDVPVQVCETSASAWVS